MVTTADLGLRVTFGSVVVSSTVNISAASKMRSLVTFISIQRSTVPGGKMRFIGSTGVKSLPAVENAYTQYMCIGSIQNLSSKPTISHNLQMHDLPLAEFPIVLIFTTTLLSASPVRLAQTDLSTPWDSLTE